MSCKVFHYSASLILALAISVHGFTQALAAPPSNDNFADATIISTLPFSGTVNNIEATVEFNEPFPCGYSPFTAWYSFTPTANLGVRIDMSGSEISDTIVSVYAQNETAWKV